MRLEIKLDRNAETPLFMQVVAGVRELIMNGTIRHGAALPSTRALSELLGVSRLTVSTAYEELTREGWIKSVPQVGTFAWHQLHNAKPVEAPKQEQPVQAELLSNYGKRVYQAEGLEDPDVEMFSELNYFSPALDLLPIAQWRQALLKSCRTEALQSRNYVSDVGGPSALREAIAAYLNRARGLRCTADQVIVFSGAQTALDLICRVLLNEGDQAVVENPGFPGSRRAFTACGARLIPVDIDERGMRVEQLKNVRAKAAYVTPAHHDPTGAVLSKDRRRALLQWATAQNAFIVEDDFDSDFRYGENPALAMQGDDTTGRVIYLSSFWKLLSPIVRLGFAIVPHTLLPVLRRAKSLVERDFHFIEHDALALFISEGHLERHIRRTRTVYAQRRQQLIEGLNKLMPGRVTMFAIGGGTHLLVRLNTNMEMKEVLAAAANAALPMVSTAPYYIGPPREGEYLISFANLDAEEMNNALQEFAEEVKS
jgi:GntR family transcriptional regulator / MocR family aminotransferase